MTNDNISPRAEFEALCDELRAARDAIQQPYGWGIHANVERYDWACEKLASFTVDHRAAIAAALPDDTAPAVLPDDWRPRPDANGD